MDTTEARALPDINGKTVLLVFCPAPGAPGPSMGLSSLQAVLNQSKIPTAVEYHNLWFAQQVGAQRLNYPKSETILNYFEDMVPWGWIFAEAAFGEDSQRDQSYLESFTDYCRNKTDPEQALDIVRTLRKIADPFLDMAAERIASANPKIVGCTTSLYQHVSSLALLRKLRTLAPEIVTVMGGWNCQGEMGSATHHNFPWVDFVVAGESEELITPLATEILEHGRNVPAERIPPSVFGPADRLSTKVSQPLPYAVCRDLDALPSPDFEDFFRWTTALGWPQRTATLPFEMSRGCWWGAKKPCTFCGVTGQRPCYDTKSPERILDQFRQLIECHNPNHVSLVDCVIDKSLLKRLAGLLHKRQERLPFSINGEIRVRNVSTEDLQGLKKLGFSHLLAGIESYNTDFLTMMNKGVEAWENVVFMRHAVDAGIEIRYNLLWGFPQENAQWYEETAALLPLLEHLPPPVLFNRLFFDRFSCFSRRAGDFSLALKPSPVYSLIYPLPDDELQKLVPFFVDIDTTDAKPHYPTYKASQREDMPSNTQTLFKAVRKWQKAFIISDEQPLLLREQRDGGLLITDTRSIAKSPQHFLTGLDMVVYLQSEQCRREEELVACLVDEEGHARSDVESAIKQLLDAGLLLLLDDRLISLATRKPAIRDSLRANYLTYSAAFRNQDDDRGRGTNKPVNSLLEILMKCGD